MVSTDKRKFNQPSEQQKKIVIHQNSKQNLGDSPSNNSNTSSLEVSNNKLGTLGDRFWGNPYTKDLQLRRAATPR